MEEEIKRCVDLLLEGKVILYPTDTVWGIGCDATNEAAVRTSQSSSSQRHEKKYYFLDKKSLTWVDSTIASLNV